MRNLLRLNNMTTLSPIEQIMNEMTARWDNVFDFSPAFSGLENKDKYPKYEILKNKKEENKFKILIAAAGMNKESFHITTLKNKLCVTYEEATDSKDLEDEEYESITNTISKRKFTQYFNANENYIIKVVSAEMKDGMLEIYVETEIPEDMKEKVIDIK